MPFLAVVLGLLAFSALLVWLLMVRMPGESHRGPLPQLTETQRGLAAELERDVRELAGEIGERNIHQSEAMAKACTFLEGSFRSAGLEPRTHLFRRGGRAAAGANVDAEIRGSARAEEIVVVGAHYDTVPGSPGANDNASGVAAMLHLARFFATAKPGRTLRFVAFDGEEPPAFQTDDMGSLRYARTCKENGENVIAMLSLETIGCYSDVVGSQSYPLPILRLVYPSQGDFVAFVGNVASKDLVRTAIGTFREAAAFPSEGAALPGWIPGVGWSDQWAFWNQGYPAIMVTDTAPFRYRHYHLASDTPDKIDYGRLARVVEGLQSVVARISDIALGAG